jgi:hypothetical protein
MTLVLAIAIATAGCGDDAAEVLAQPGAEGRCGVERRTRALASDEGSVTADVYRPFVDELLPPPSPPVIFVQGGLVAPERYRWFAAHEAARCFVVAVPHHAGDLAFFSQDASGKALAALRALTRDDADELAGLVDAGADAVFAGHSLGGVVATKAWLDEARATLILLASEPDAADHERIAHHLGRVLSIVGSRDGKETPAEARAGAARFRDADFVVVDGMNHYELTDDPTASELSSDGHATIDSDDAHEEVLALVDDVIVR